MLNYRALMQGVRTVMPVSIIKWVAGSILVVVIWAGLSSIFNFGLVPGVGFDDFVGLPTVVEVDIEDQITVDIPNEPEIIRIDPIALDCRARTDVAVSARGIMDHYATIDLPLVAPKRVVYRTDSLEYQGVGDVETCVPPEASTIFQTTKETKVTIDASQVVFNRPRLTFAKDFEINYDQGLLGKITNAAPWVSDDSPLYDLTLHQAQKQVASESCMRKAWSATQAAVRNAYYGIVAEQYGIDASSITVHFVGEPNFWQAGKAPDEATSQLRGFDVETRFTNSLSCIIKLDGTTQQPTIP